MKHNSNLKNSLLTTLLIGSLMAPAAIPASAAPGSLAIDSAVLQMLVDADNNGIANIGDTLLIEVSTTNTDGYADTSATADLRTYGYAAAEALIQGSGAAENTFTKQFVIVDAGLSGVDVAADNASSAVNISATDVDEAAPLSALTNTIGVGHGGIDAVGGVDTATPTNQNTVFTASDRVKNSSPVSITSAAEVEDQSGLHHMELLPSVQPQLKPLLVEPLLR